MTYLETHRPLKAQPSEWLPKARSAIVIAQNYLPHPAPQETPLKHLKIARYARGADYHYFLKDRLKTLAEKLQNEFSEELFFSHTDSSPIMERDLGYRAQLGWFGKNSCLIHPKKGSFFLLGEILTSLPLNADKVPLTDFCGTCTRCIDQCPTGAIKTDRTLDAKKCISYLNIELQTVPDSELIPQMGEWFFGCDICQEVCPWNKKAFGPSLADTTATHDEKLEDLRFLLNSSNKNLERNFKHTPLWRRRAFGLKRNALIVAANISAVELSEDIRALAEKDPKLKALALWVLEKLEDRILNKNH